MTAFRPSGRPAPPGCARDERAEQERTVKAITYHRYGSPDVLAFEEVDDPVVNDDEVLVRVRAASLNPRDWHFMRGIPYFMRLQFGLRAPKDMLLGSDVAGQVEAVGKAVTRVKPGDEVLADVVTGGFAEYARVPETLLAPKPASLSFEQAAAVPLAALTALQGLRDHARLRPGHRVLIIGASGGIGTFAVQLAKHFGAHVTGVCSGRNVDLVRSLGADHVIDYTREDFTRGGQAYDLIFQLAGTRSPAACRRALTPTGTLLPTSGDSKGRWIGPVDRMIKAAALSPFVRQRLVMFLAKRSGEDLRAMTELIASGTVAPVIDRTYPLSEVPEAMRHLETGRARGKIVVTV
jgi:NADPH:quinone reductase-like Zn-dependent oxidoreductase